ncbi:MAG: M3 family oligoendopeptidase [Anaerolineae bacterium]|nr:M3 family oligoendopeptidase [Anaerolineae bacterium]
MFENLPNNYQASLTWTWPDFAPFVQDLLERPLTAETLDTWLKDYTRLAQLASELSQRLMVAHNLNTEAAEAEAAYMRYVEEIMPNMIHAQFMLDRKLIESGLEPPHYDVVLRNLRGQQVIFREANLPLFVEEDKLRSRYDKLIGAQTVIWEGEEKTLPQLEVVFHEPDRNRREQAWRRYMDRKLQDRAALDELWQSFLSLRLQVAANAEQPDYRAYMWQSLARHDYTPEDSATFRQAIRQVVTPAMQRLNERRRQQLGVEALRPWDLQVDPTGRAPLQPFGDIEALNTRTHEMFNQVDPALGGYFQHMRAEALLDLENRKAKAPGGYCTEFAQQGVPFIFMNAVGLHDDVQTLLHEGGHAFHVFETHKLPYFHQRMPPIEFAEVASMSMELLAAPYLLAEHGGFYNTEEAARARIEHLEGILRFLPYMAVVDGFQHWVYTHPQAAQDPAQCDATWTALWDEFMLGVDWSGLEDIKATGWHRKLHIYQIPFYYIEYGMAQVGALQVWLNAQEDQAGAVRRYREALALGGTAALPDLFAAAGVQFRFDASMLTTLVERIEATLGELEGVLASSRARRGRAGRRPLDFCRAIGYAWPCLHRISQHPAERRACYVRLCARPLHLAELWPAGFL